MEKALVRPWKKSTEKQRLLKLILDLVLSLTVALATCESSGFEVECLIPCLIFFICDATLQIFTVN